MTSVDNKKKQCVSAAQHTFQGAYLFVFIDNHKLQYANFMHKHNMSTAIQVAKYFQNMHDIIKTQWSG